MGGMSSTPKMAETIEYMYEEVYGKLAKGADDLTLAQAQADTDFWNSYGKYTATASVAGDGKITYSTLVDDKNKQNIVLDKPADVLISTGTAYHTIIYYALCQKYSVEPYSDAAFNKTELVNDFRSIAKGSLLKDSIQTSTPDLVKYYADDYISDAGSLKTYDLEQMGKDVKKFTDQGKSVILMGSGTIAKDKNKSVYDTVTASGGEIALNSATSIPTTYAGIDLVGKIFGLQDYTDKVIQDLQLRLYKVWWSVQEKKETHKAYFEGSSGTASKSTGSGAELCKFLGFDVTLFDGKEHDTENLLAEKPDVLIFYTNDTRDEDVKMRIATA
jgi:ABC-type Fe3+-hydroxamate transport system substrate-binding protein